MSNPLARFAGYDLLNEPIAPDGKSLAAFYAQIIETIRAVDPNHMIFLEGGQLATDFSMFTKPSCKNMAYSCHIYQISGDGDQKLKGFQSFAVQQNRPMWVGEFGESKDDSWIDQKVTQFQQCSAICGWSFWTWKKVSGDTVGLVKVPASPGWLAIMRRVRYPWLQSILPLRTGLIHEEMNAFPDKMSDTNTADPQTLKALHLK
jgi:hypothetical protein